MVRSTQESILRIDGRAIELKDIEETPIVWREQRPILVREAAEVKFGGPIPRGGGGVWVKEEGGGLVGGDAIILAVQKQPGVDIGCRCGGGCCIVGGVVLDGRGVSA